MASTPPDRDYTAQANRWKVLITLASHTGECDHVFDTAEKAVDWIAAEARRVCLAFFETEQSHGVAAGAADSIRLADGSIGWTGLRTVTSSVRTI